MKLSPNFFNRDLLEISSHVEDKLKKLELPEGTVYLLLNNQEDGRGALCWGWICYKRKVKLFSLHLLLCQHGYKILKKKLNLHGLSINLKFLDIKYFISYTFTYRLILI